MSEYKKTFNNIGYLGVFVACYFLIHVIYPKNALKDLFGIRDFHPAFYYVAMTILAVSSGMIVSLFSKATVYIEEKLKQNIADLISLIFKRVPKEHESEVWDTLERVANE